MASRWNWWTVLTRPGCVPHNNVLRKADTSMHDPYRERIPEPGRHSSFILNHIVSRPKKTVFNRSVTNATMMSTASASAPSLVPYLLQRQHMRGQIEKTAWRPERSTCTSEGNFALFTL
ncbi:unnamed protein product [Peronospora belbahrii]|uniref:Uncharacterized protein n=1 Tax=Peronospora belbahrii TaxID=622444 RepID=A0AAU9KJC2_9STRA|nr:unnamed protein product [Peronospora belbahrii]